MIWDLAIAGGGPSGLAFAIRAARRGLRAVVLERSEGPPDKACGEGLMPSGARELSRLGVRVEGHPFRGIRYVQDRCAVEARFRDGEGLGIRRTALSQALQQRAREAGADLRRGTVRGAVAGPQSVDVSTDGGTLQARLLVAADGLHSPLRRSFGLEEPQPDAVHRYGIRRHFDIAPWSDMVEVHWTDHVEAYVTPVGERSVNVAFLAQGALSQEKAGPADGGRFAQLLRRFPALEERLSGAEPGSDVRGAGPLLQRVRARHAHRLALLGDAAGYVDAITGQGLSLAFASAALLMDALPGDLTQDLTPSLLRYDRSLRAQWLRYSVPAHALVALSRRPRLRRGALRSLSAVPPVFGALLRLVG